MLAVRHVTVAALVAVGLGVVGSTSARAQATVLTIDSSSPTLEKQEGGSWTASLGFTNVTKRPLDIKVEPKNQSNFGCKPKLSTPELPPAEHTEEQLTIPAACHTTSQSIEFTISVNGKTPQEFHVTATERPAAPSPNWHYLLVFPIALAAALIIIFGVCISRTGSGYLSQALVGLDNWSFTESWATNITALGTLVAVIFSSTEVLTTLLGQDAKGPVALATVGATIGAAIAGAAPIVLGATKTSDGDFNTAGGLLAAAAVTLTGALGEMFVIWGASKELSLGHLGHLMAGASALIAGLLLVIYVARSIPAILTHGMTPPAPPPPSSDMIAAAKTIVASFSSFAAGDEDQAAETIAPHLQVMAAQAAAAPRRPRRSALL